MRRVAHILALFAAAFGLMMQPAMAADEPVVQVPTLPAQALLERGEAKQAYYQLRDQLETGVQTAAAHVLAAKAALARAKTAPLLRKKKWAKRGRDHYLAALSLEENQPDALFGLATFALRAPAGLGGGEEAFADYRSRLEAAAPAKAIWLKARMHAENKLYTKSLEHYAQAISQQDESALSAEYAALAVEQNQAGKAYSVVNSAASSQAPCGQYTLATLAQAATLNASDILAHYDAFLNAEQRYCNRQFVALDAAQAAKVIAAGAGLLRREAHYSALIAALKSDRVTTQKPSDIAS